MRVKIRLILLIRRLWLKIIVINGDLRELIATMQVAAELDRIGDHARHMAEAVGVVSQPVLGRARVSPPDGEPGA